MHDLVDIYTEMTPKMHAKNATPSHPKIGRDAKRRGQVWCAAFVAFFCLHFWRHFGVIFNRIVQ